MAAAISHHRPEQDPLAISLAALAEDGGSLPETSIACVGDVIDVSMQDGFLRCAAAAAAAADDDTRAALRPGG